MRGTVIKVSDWMANTPPKSRRYWVTVELEDDRHVTFFNSLENQPPDGLWEEEEVEVVWKRHKETGLELPFIV